MQPWGSRDQGSSPSIAFPSCVTLGKDNLSVPLFLFL